MSDEKEISRLARITSIAIMIKSKRIVTAAQIARRFNVSIRTVYRDIKTLESSGVPVIMIEGKGYSIMEGYTLPALMFTEAEANALVTAGHLISKTKDSSLTSNYQEALEKIKSVIRSGIKEKSELLSDRILILRKSGQDQTSNSLSALQLAVTNHTHTKIDYHKPNDSEAQTRFIEPHVLCYLNENWILVAWCRLRHSFRSFRIDRMSKIEFLESTFTNRETELRKHFATWPKDIF